MKVYSWGLQTFMNTFHKKNYKARRKNAWKSIYIINGRTHKYLKNEIVVIILKWTIQFSGMRLTAIIPDCPIGDIAD